MANPKLPTNGTHELQERYAKTILAIARKKLGLRENHSGRDYTGDPLAGAIKIPVRDDEVVVGNYDVVAGINLTTSGTTYENVLVNKNRAINELIDDFESNAIPDNVRAQRLISAGYGLQKAGELDFVSQIEKGNAYGNTTALTVSNVYAEIAKMVGNLTKRGIDKETIRVAITTDTETLLLTDEQYSNTASQVGSERAMTGVVNMIRGVQVIVSDNLSLPTEVVVYSTDYAQAGDEWSVMPDFNPLQDGKHIGASALQARTVSWDKLTRAYGAEVKTQLIELTVASEAGSTGGDTLITVTEDLESGNSYVYKVDTAATAVTPLTELTTGWTAWDGTADITAATGTFITVVEVDANNRAIKIGSAEVTAA